MPTSDETDTVDRLAKEFRDWYEENMMEVNAPSNPKDVARPAFEAGWRAAFEVVLDHQRPEL